MDSSQEYSDDHPTNNEDAVYYAERILNKKYENGQKFYLVKWQNFPEESATWEPKANLINLTEMIGRFERNLQRLKKKHTREGEAYFEDSQEKISRKKQKEHDGNAKPREYKKPQESKKAPKIDHDRALPTIGHLRYKDKPQEIISIRQMNDPELILFRVRWQKRLNGITPSESYISNKDFMRFEPRFLLAFYQSKIKLRNFDHVESMNIDSSRKEDREEQKGRENSLLGNIEKERNLLTSSLKSKRGFTNPLSEIQMNKEDETQERSAGKAVIEKYSAARESEKASVESSKVIETEKPSAPKDLPEHSTPKIQVRRENKLESELSSLTASELLERYQSTVEKEKISEVKEVVEEVEEGVNVCSEDQVNELFEEGMQRDTEEKGHRREVEEEEADKLADLAEEIPNLNETSEEENMFRSESNDEQEERYY